MLITKYAFIYPIETLDFWIFYLKDWQYFENEEHLLRLVMAAFKFLTYCKTKNLATIVLPSSDKVLKDV